MARIRSLKPDLWQDEAIGEVSLLARLIFVGLITQADDQGRLKGDPRLIHSLLFPYDSTDPPEVSGGLAELSGAGLIEQYTVNGKPFIALPNWSRHQRISHPKDSALPSPESADSTPSPETSGGSAEASGGCVSGRDRSKEGKGKEQKGREGGVGEGKPKPNFSSDFEEWLKHYHSITGKTAVRGSSSARTFFAARRREGLSLEDLKLATVGCNANSYLRENSFDVPDTILKPGNVERYIDLGRKLASSPTRPRQSLAGFEEVMKVD